MSGVPVSSAPGTAGAVPAVRGLLIAVGSAVLAGLIRLALDPVMGHQVPFALFFIAVVISVRYAGLWPALLTLMIGLTWSALFWFPRGLTHPETLSSLLVYVVSGLAIIGLGLRMRSAEALAEGRARQLLETVNGLRASQGRLQLATEVSGIGVFEWDIRNDRFTGENPEAYRIFGRIETQRKLSMAEFIGKHLHPEDSERVQQELQLAMRPEKRFHVVFRSRPEAGEWRWVEVAGRFLFEGGQPTHLIGVIADISERKAMEDNLREMAANLSEADHRKDEFLATLAHELRNPLAPIRNGIELLKRGEGNVAQSRGVIGIMERQMSHMVRLVDDLIDVSRITRNKLELRKQRVEVAQVLRTAVEASRPLIDAKDHALELHLPPAAIFLDADPTRLVQVITNLLNNSVKYTDRGGRIELSAERDGRDVLITVSDNGSGIPEPLLPRVFEMFTQLDASLERSQGGLGIGLSMVKRLVELHGGSVRISGREAQRGTRAQVRLPVILAPVPLPCTVAERGSGPMLPRRIVVADDNVDAADSLAGILRLMGHDVRVVNDGVEAVEKAERFLPDVVMLDIGMPRMNGYEACRRIRDQPANRDVMIIAVTGWGQEEDRLRSEEAGFNIHLTKPVDPAAVESLLNALPAPRP